ncbi:hypothetical protein [Nocardioides speluncae]|uniref:hypothetical protein n=1 Tax=Nocardioides speluncae TaxID=2670337 RepID=UPI000D69E637|nr:hypothetical protein [Nocardioides speluncae]
MRRLGYAVLAAALLTSMIAFLPAHASTDTTLTARLEYLKRQQPRGFGGYFELHVTTDGPVADGTVRFETPRGVKVDFYDWEQGWDFEGGGGQTWYLTLTNNRAGWSRVTLVVDAANAEPVRVPFQIYAPGGPTPPATGNLAGRRYAASGSDYFPPSGYSYSIREAVWFLDRRFAYVGVPRHGKPTCTAAKVNPNSFTGCQRYWWDKAANRLQVGKWAGRVHARSLDYFNYRYTHRVGMPAAGKRFGGAWTDWLHYYGSNVTFRLRLNADGSFRWVKDGKVSRGRYAVGANGRLTLRFRNGHTEVRTLLVGLNRHGKQDPRATGLLLSLPDKDLRAVWLTPVR